MTAEQQRHLLGDRRYKAVPADARSILTTPRLLEYVRGLRLDELPALRTAADVYWRAIDHMLVRAWEEVHTSPDGAVARLDPEDRERFWAVLGALAFTMYARSTRDTETTDLQPNLDRIPASDMSGFLRETFDRLHRALPAFSPEQYKTARESLGRLNFALNHGWFESRTIGREVALLWRNASLQEFLAAFWVCRWGEADAAVLLETLTEPGRGTGRGRR